MTTAWKIENNGNDITQKLRPYMRAISLADERGITSDDLTLNLIDTASTFALPLIGSRLGFWLGDTETGLVFKGTFMVDEFDISGPPDQIEIRASSVDFSDKIKVKRDAYYENQTVGEIIQTIARRNGLEPAINQVILNYKVARYIVQKDESDLSLLTRLAKDIGAYCTVKYDKIIASSVGSSETAGGKPLSVYAISRARTSTFRLSSKARNNTFSGVRASYRDYFGVITKTELAGDDSGSVKSIPGLFQTQEYAQRAAHAEFDRLRRGILTLSLTLIGDALLIPEMTVTLSGFNTMIDNTKWTVRSVNHIIGDQGFTSELMLDVKSLT